MSASTIADRLAELMARRGLSLQGLAEAATRGGVPVTKQGVADYVRERDEGERKKIPGDFLAAVCNDLGVSPWWLLLGVGQPDDPPPDSDAYRQGADDATARVLEAVRQVRHAVALPWPAESNPPLVHARPRPGTSSADGSG